MRIPRIYQPIPLSRGQRLELDAQATVHLTKVLRLRVGDSLVIFNGQGGEYTARLGDMARRTATIEIGEWMERSVESPLELVLLQGVSRGERMDYTVQKAVELGVSRIVPVITERTVVNLKADRQLRRCEHWQSVVNSACEQSGRNRVPRVSPIASFAEAIGEAAAAPGLKLVLHHRAATNLIALPAPQGPVSLLIGPEGGLSAQEIAAAEAGGFVPLCLGPRVLRTETAALAALAVLQWQWGDFSASGGIAWDDGE
ncbi:MAG: 16S rRNA (uracil(1498)-N(3))-methyltransferase [Gammaproteobacteria bacterium]|nr:16S rRNA (uracil(1498)-N(3))-methyltransferase [Gammaproteobacteria bacterium]